MKKYLLAFGVLLAATLSNAQMSDEKIAQYVHEQQEKGASQEQIVTELNRKGVTVEQLQRLRARYENGNYNGIIGKTVQTGNVSARTRTGQQALNPNEGLMNSYSGSNEPLRSIYEESSFLFADSTDSFRQNSRGIRIFGQDIFRSRNLTFESSANIATPRNYRLGPGDEVIIDIWGASQSTVRQVISPDGNIMVEDLGPVSLGGMTVEKADSYLKKVFSQIYSGLSDDNGESNIKLSLGQNRSIQINVMGDVMNPGTYMVSSFATVFNALYLAGGPSDNGSLRNVKLFRNGKQKAVIDVYQYILNGILPEDIRLEDNDVIMVPSQSVLVNIDGSIRRPMYYEMKENETLATLIEYAGGMSSNAYRNDVRVIRTGDVQRQICTVTKDNLNTFALNDGDMVYVDSTMSTFSNMVEIRGAVFRPGKFQSDSGINTVSALVRIAGGLREDAFTSRALLSRTNPDKTLVNETVDILGIMEGRCNDIPLRSNDILFIPSHFDMGEQPVLGIFGEVMFPGKYHFADNTGIEDLVFQAGGFKANASVAKIDVVRRNHDRKALEKDDTLAQVFSFSIDENLNIQQNSFTLEPFDEVYVRRSPGYSDNKKVIIEGEVLFPGYYSLSSVNETVSDLIERAGMCTSEAYLAGARLERQMTDDERKRMSSMAQNLSADDSVTMVRTLARLRDQTKYDVGINLAEALKNPHKENDIQLRDGDRIVIPAINSTVQISGAVMYSNTIAHVKGKSMRYYISKAGGYAPKAKKRKTYVVYMNGMVEKGRHASIEPGCGIIVPNKPVREGMNASQLLSLGSTSASLATVVLALLNLVK